jgi:hypothetical protein
MLADGAEATVRSRRPNSMEELEQIVGESIQSRMLAGQLDQCPLTLGDLQLICKAFVDVLRGLHHPRILYPPEMLPARGSLGEFSQPVELSAMPRSESSKRHARSEEVNSAPTASQEEVPEPEKTRTTDDALIGRDGQSASANPGR